jgi:hypothetical protein
MQVAIIGFPIPEPNSILRNDNGQNRTQRFAPELRDPVRQPLRP